MLACGTTGKGKMPEPSEMLPEYILKEIAVSKGPGREKSTCDAPALLREVIDPVRFISNHSTGKMGYAIAENCHAERSSGDSGQRTLRH